jgi:dipeptidyl aminopeptidase/acylaminoacyl peptidase
MRRFAALAAGCVLLAPFHTVAHPFTVSDLLAQERLGTVQVDAQQRWLVVQRFARWDSAPLYDMDADTALGLSRIQVFDLARGGVERRLDLGDAKAGYVPAALSPSGAKLAVYRIAGHAIDLGVVDLATGAVAWLGVVPRLPVIGRTLVWRGDDALIVATRSPDTVDSFFGYGWIVQSRLPALWAASARGEAAVSAFGSGRWLGLRAKATPGQLISFDIATGHRTVLADETVLDLELAPTGSALAVLIDGEDLPPQPGLAHADESSRRRRLLIIDPRSGARREPVPQADIMVRLLSWSPSGTKLLVFARPPTSPWPEGRYYLISDEGRAEPLAVAGLKPAVDGTVFNGALARGTWLHGAPVARLTSGERADWWRIAPEGAANLTARLPPQAQLVATSPDSLLMTAGGGLWRVTPGGVQALPKTAQARSVRAKGLGDRGLYVPSAMEAVVIEDGAHQLRTLSGQGLPPLAPGETLVALAPRHAIRIAVTRDAHGVETVGMAVMNGSRQSLLTINTALADVDFARAQSVVHKGIDGEVLTSWLYMPVGASPTRRAPLVVIPYPGQRLDGPPAGQTPPAFSLIANAQVMVGQGYAVLIPALPYRKDREPTEALADQILAAVDAAASQAPLDVDRLALYGHSYGGYAVVAAATQNTRFKAIIASAATTNLISAYGRQTPALYAAPEFGPTIASAVAWHETGQTRMGGPPWADPDRYLRNSPVVHADRIVAPVLMIYGDLDNEVTQPQGLFAALFRQNKDAILAIYRGESHVPLSPGNVRDLHARIFGFLDETIGPGLEPN